MSYEMSDLKWIKKEIQTIAGKDREACESLYNLSYMFYVLAFMLIPVYAILFILSIVGAVSWLFIPLGIVVGGCAFALFWRLYRAFMDKAKKRIKSADRTEEYKRNERILNSYDADSIMADDWELYDIDIETGEIEFLDDMEGEDDE